MTLVITAVVMDVRDEKIHNELVGVGILGILLKLSVAFNRENLIESVLGMIIPILSLFLLFYFHMLGAGDIKLLSVIGGFLGVRDVVFVMCLSFGFGALLSMVKMLRQHNLLERFAYFANYVNQYRKTGKRHSYIEEGQKKNSCIHFSIPIAMAVMIYYAGRIG